MTDSTPIRHLEKAADFTALALKMFSGQVFGKFKTATQFWDRMDRRSVSSGKSWQWIRHGDSSTEDHTGDGTQLLGNDLATDEVNVLIDDMLVAHHDVSFLDTDRAHFDILGPIGDRMGYQIAKDYDSRVARLIATGAQDAAVTDIHPGGQVVTRGGADLATAYPTSPTGAKAFRDDLWSMATAYDADDVPEMERVCYIPPIIREVLGQDDRIWDRDFSGAGFPDRVIGRIAGFDIVVSNQIPNTNVATGPTKYQGDFSDVIALCTQGNMGVVGVTLGNLRTVIEDDNRRLTKFLSATIHIGFGVVQTETLGLIEVDGV